MLVTLGEKGVKTLDDLGDLASDELVEFLGKDALDEDTANDIIMAARAHWFDDGEAAPAALSGDDDAEATETDADADAADAELPPPDDAATGEDGAHV